MSSPFPDLVLPTEEQRSDLPFSVLFYETREFSLAAPSTQTLGGSNLIPAREWCDDQFQKDSEGNVIPESMWYSYFIGITHERFAHLFCFRTERDAVAFKVRWC